NQNNISISKHNHNFLFFKKKPYLVKFALTSHNVHHPPEQSEGCGDGEKELSAFVFTRFMPIPTRVYIPCHLISFY
ncbi:hypothetical protein, partial [Serratia bockelmannii]|uniref:hypothetical protein n=1 Tax=Serratia bockelmannii TaxID=2703793 RepID=UPI0036A0B9F6